ncbi:MAG: hypothetical protein KAW02_00210 [candidate division Zixibacteria bacterium]|nr:hypothetical protein [candidate division Zixibacteria bacterium]
MFFVFIIHPGINGYSRAMFPDMVYGKAYKPFVYRTLLPTTIRIVSEITPEYVKDRIKSAVQDCNPQRKRIRMMKALGWETEYIYEYLIALTIMFLCFLGFAFLLRYLIGLFYDFPSFIADIAPVGALLILPIFFKYYSYIYDPCTLFLFTLAVTFIAKKRTLPFYVVFFLATLNKETSILLAGVFFIRQFKVMRNSSLAKHLLFQMLIWIVVKASLTTIFKNNQGSFCEFHLIYNLGLVSKPLELLYFVSVILIFSVLIRCRWTEKPIFLRHSLFVTMIPLMLLALFLGYIDELRVYYEALPFLFLLSLPTVVDIFKLSYNDTLRR